MGGWGRTEECKGVWGRLESLPPFSQAFVEVVCSQAAGRWSKSISLEQDLPPQWFRATAERGLPRSVAENVAWRTWKQTGLRMCIRTNELTRQKGTHGLETGRGLAGPGQGEGRAGQPGMDVSTWLHLKQTACKDLLYSARISARVTWRLGRAGGWGERGHMCMYG